MENTQPQEAKQPKRLTVHPVVVVIFILLFLGIGGLIGSSDNHRQNVPNSNTQHQTAQPTTTSKPITITDPPESTEGRPTVTPTKPLTLEERIKAKLNYLNGDTKVTEVSTDTDLDITTNRNLPGKIAVLITYHMNGTYLDTSWTKRGSWNIDKGIIEDIFLLDKSINTIIMVAEVPVTTAYGKDDFSMLDTVTVSRDTFTQINFAKFDSQNLPTIADHYIEDHNIKD